MLLHTKQFTLRKSKSVRPKREKEEECDKKGEAHLRESGKGEGTSDECERARMTKLTSACVFVDSLYFNSSHTASKYYSAIHDKNVRTNVKTNIKTMNNNNNLYFS